MFVLDMPTPSIDIHQYPSTAPGEIMSSELTIPLDLKPGKYNICAEILILGDLESENQKPKVCVQIFYHKYMG